MVDVVVTEGFSGNIALKTAEGTARQAAAYLRAAHAPVDLGRGSAIFSATSAFKALREKIDPRRANGGVFLGLNGIVIKSHGGTDARGFAAAVDIAVEMARSNLVSRIAADIGTSMRQNSAPVIPIDKKAVFCERDQIGRVGLRIVPARARGDE